MNHSHISLLRPIILKMAASYDETTNSDEQYRLQKQIEGSTGMMTYQDAIDEEIDNAIDAGATLCEITFDEEGEKGICRKIYNDGNPMNNSDRQAYLTLDSRNKKKQNERNPNKCVKGRFGHGSSCSRSRLSGQGVHLVTSKDHETLIHQATIELNYLAYECPNERCWTSNHDKRPKFVAINDETETKKYKIGATKEYFGDNLEQRFDKNELIIHLSKKYSNAIEYDNFKIIIVWNEDKYQVPSIFNDEHKETVRFCFPSDPNIEAMFKVRDTIYRITPAKNKRTFSCYESKKDTEKSLYNSSTKFSTEILFPKVNEVQVNFNNLTKKESIRHRFINTTLKSIFKNIDYDETNKNIVLNCGENNIYIDCQEKEEENSKTKTNFTAEVLVLLDTFIPGIIIDCNKHTLCYRDFDKERCLISTDNGSRYLKYGIIRLKLDETLIRVQENKSKIELKSIIQALVGKIIEKFNKEVSADVKRMVTKNQEEEEEQNIQVNNTVQSLPQEDDESSTETTETSTQEGAETGTENDVEDDNTVSTTVINVAPSETTHIETERAAEEKDEVGAEEIETNILVDEKTKSSSQPKKSTRVNEHYKNSVSKIEAIKIWEKYIASFPGEDIDDVEAINTMLCRINKHR